MRRLRTIRIAAWLAIVAMALDVLWPLLAHARPGTPADLLTISCSTDGASRVPAPRGAPAGPQDPLGPHCVFCAAGAGKAALSANPAAIDVGEIRGATVAGSPDSVPRRVARFEDSRPRAPPALS